MYSFTSSESESENQNENIEELTSLSTTELRYRLFARGLSENGDKNILIARLRNAMLNEEENYRNNDGNKISNKKNISNDKNSKNAVNNSLHCSSETECVKGELFWDIDWDAIETTLATGGGQSIKSLTINVAGYDWYAELYPNGETANDPAINDNNNDNNNRNSHHNSNRAVIANRHNNDENNTANSPSLFLSVMKTQTPIQMRYSVQMYDSLLKKYNKPVMSSLRVYKHDNHGWGWKGWLGFDELKNFCYISNDRKRHINNMNNIDMNNGDILDDICYFFDPSSFHENNYNNTNTNTNTNNNNPKIHYKISMKIVIEVFGPVVTTKSDHKIDFQIKSEWQSKMKHLFDDAVHSDLKLTVTGYSIYNNVFNTANTKNVKILSIENKGNHNNVSNHNDNNNNNNNNSNNNNNNNNNDNNVNNNDNNNNNNNNNDNHLGNVNDNNKSLDSDDNNDNDQDENKKAENEENSDIKSNKSKKNKKSQSQIICQKTNQWQENLNNERSKIKLEISCHRCILSSFSNVFNAMLEHKFKENIQSTIEINENNEIENDNVDPWMMYVLIKYIYCESIEDNIDLCSLMLLSDRFQINRLVLICLQQLSDTINIRNVSTILSASNKLHHVQSAIDVKSQCLNFISLHLGEVMNTPSYKSILANDPCLMNDLLTFISTSQLKSSSTPFKHNSFNFNYNINNNNHTHDNDNNNYNLKRRLSGHKRRYLN